MKQFEYNKDDLDLMYSAFSVDFGEDHPLSPTDFIRANGILRIIEKGILMSQAVKYEVLYAVN